MKCIPITLFFLFVFSAKTSIEIEDVFDDKIVSLSQSKSNSLKRLPFRLISSLIASTTRKEFFKSLISVDVFILFIALNILDSVITFFLNCLCMLILILFIAFSKIVLFISIRITSYPYKEKTWAIPFPIVPAPIIPISFLFIIKFLACFN